MIAISDLRRIPWTSVAKDGAVSFVRHKTGKAMSFQLDDKAYVAALAIADPQLILPWPFTIGTYFPREWRKFTRFAGVRELGPKSIRRSAITYTYIEQGEDAARQLAGHSSFAITAKHYVDWSIAKKPVFQPPKL